MSDCIFCKIASGDIKSDIVYQDADYTAIRDINPQAPVHVVIIPRAHVPTLNDVTDFGVIAGAYKAAVKTAEKLGLMEDGYRVVSNCNAHGGQTVFHIHFHLLGGRPMKWPPG